MKIRISQLFVFFVCILAVAVLLLKYASPSKASAVDASNLAFSTQPVMQAVGGFTFFVPNINYGGGADQSSRSRTPTRTPFTRTPFTRTPFTRTPATRTPTRTPATRTPTSVLSATATRTLAPTKTRTPTPATSATPAATRAFTPTSAVSLTPTATLPTGTPVAGLAGYFVATTGNDANPGTQSQPWRTIGKAARVAAAGDTVYVRGGVYAEQVIIAKSGTQDKPIRFLAYPGETPVIEGSGLSIPNWSSLLELRGNWIVVSGFEVRNSKYMGVELSGQHNVVDNVYFA